MSRLTPEDLKRIAQKMQGTMNMREGIHRGRIVVHMGTCGIAAGARTVMAAIMEEVEKRKLTDIAITISSCAGLCSREPMVTVEIKDEAPVKYVDLNADKARVIVEKHIVGHEIVKEYALASGNERVL